MQQWIVLRSIRRNTLLPALLGWATVSGYDADLLSHFYPDTRPIFSAALTYLKNIAERMAIRSLLRLAVHAPRKSWLQLAESLLDQVAEHGLEVRRHTIGERLDEDVDYRDDDEDRQHQQGGRGQSYADPERVADGRPPEDRLAFVWLSG